MGLTDESLRRAPEAVFRVWRNRLRVEIEAASLFASLGAGLEESYGPRDEIAALSRGAAFDELRHANHCRKILGVSSSSDELTTAGLLGPSSLGRDDRVLYTCVAVGCVTETLSAALLVDMYRKAAPGIIKETVHSILEDEVTHGRIGWAELARASKSRDVAWLSAHVPAMIRAATVGDVEPMLSAREGEWDLSEWGILTPARSSELIEEAIEGVILPGLREYGIRV